MENLEPPATGIYVLLFHILFLLVCKCFKYDHCIQQSHPTTELTYRVHCDLFIQTPVHDHSGCTDLELLDLREWVESVNFF